MRHLKRFWHDRSGNFAMLSAAVTIPLIMGTGMAIDVSNIARQQGQLQNAVDSAVLAIAREGKDLAPEAAEEIARQFLAGNFGLDLEDVQVRRDGTRYNLDVKSASDLAFGGLVGYDTWPIAASASADIAYASYEIGLVLDTTGSMAGGKLQAMKDAVSGLVDTMSAQVKDKEKLRFSIVPFSSFVNVGPEHGPKFDATGRQIAGTGASWLDLEGATPIPQLELPGGLSRFQVYEHLGLKWPGCVETRPLTAGATLGVDLTVPDAVRPETLFVPVFALDEEDSGYVNNYLPGAVKTNSGTGAAFGLKMRKYGIPVNGSGKFVPFGLTTSTTSNGLNRWTKVSPDTGNSVYAGHPKGPGFGCVSQPLMPLTNDYAGLKSKVNSLKASGNTNIMEGVSWGMRTLAPQPPFSQGKSRALGVEKMMIVLTDGSNTFGTNSTELGSLYTSFGHLSEGRLGISAGGSAATTTEMNRHTLAACTNAKAAGIEVYTIRLEEPNIATGTMLKECATSPDHYFDVPTRSKLDDAFKQIRDKIVRVRIAS
jgi:Flp pilus assembly protein TadG